MMNFTKAVASGNDFVIVDNRTGQAPGKSGQGANWCSLAKKLCERKTGIGADGLLLLEDSRGADVKMRIFNPDGSEVDMCGNGSRCVALYCNKKQVKIETRAGILQAELSSKNKVKVRITNPKDLKIDFSVNLNGEDYKAYYINTGVPHVVYFLEGLDSLDVKKIGRLTRYYKDFQPEGTNANFVKFLDKKSIAIRTYERGVEDETLACGTGACASAIIASLVKEVTSPVNVSTRSGEILKVYFDKDRDVFKDVYLEGEVRIIYKGQVKRSPNLRNKMT